MQIDLGMQKKIIYQPTNPTASGFSYRSGHATDHPQLLQQLSQYLSLVGNIIHLHFPPPYEFDIIVMFFTV